MKVAGVQVAPFYKINLFLVANRINYRNHRKIVVVDGNTSFVGGINISDQYRNDTKEKDGLFWRDTHLQIVGNASAFLQSVFISDWNFCTEYKLEIRKEYFPENPEHLEPLASLAQIAPSGPDSDDPTIYYSLIQAISNAEKQILITSPYFIPGVSLMDALMIAATSGVEVKIIVPGVSDSKIVNAAASSYYSELLPVGVSIFQYQKGFVHAKTMVIDDDLSFVGTANMDYRSFDLNFEVNAIVYGTETANELIKVFEQDLLECDKIDPIAWRNRPKYRRIWDKSMRLLSPFL